MKNITSKDPRKAEIVEAFKSLTGATKVTLLRQRKDGAYVAHCLRYGAVGGFVSIGERAIVPTGLGFAVVPESGK